MKTLIKNSINRFGLLILLAASISWAGCEMFASHTNPIAGWKPDFAPQLDPVVAKNCQDYIQTLPSKERERAGPIFYFEDGTGQHAVQIRIGINGTSWEHILIYDKDNKRIKTIKYISGRYAS